MKLSTSGIFLILFGLVTATWLARVIIDPSTPGVNVYRFGAKWFVYTYVTAFGVLLLPFAAIFLICAIVTTFGTRNYRFALSIALVVTALWAAVGTYGFWYATCRENHSVAYCQ